MERYDHNRALLHKAFRLASRNYRDDDLNDPHPRSEMDGFNDGLRDINTWDTGDMEGLLVRLMKERDACLAMIPATPEVIAKANAYFTVHRYLEKIKGYDPDSVLVESLYDAQYRAVEAMMRGTSRHLRKLATKRSDIEQDARKSYVERFEQ